jgi:hypothetical protein
MAPVAYIPQLHKFNSFMQNGLFRRDRFCIESEFRRNANVVVYSLDTSP